MNWQQIIKEQMEIVNEIERKAYQAGYEFGFKKVKEEAEKEKFEAEQDLAAETLGK